MNAPPFSTRLNLLPLLILPLLVSCATSSAASLEPPATPEPAKIVTVEPAIKSTTSPTPTATATAVVAPTRRASPAIGIITTISSPPSSPSPPAESPTPTVSPSATPTQTHTPSPTATHTQTPAPSATPTQTQTVTPTPTFTATTTPREGIALAERYLLVDQDEQTMVVYEQGVTIRQIPVSTGAPVSNTFTPSWEGIVGDYWGSGPFRNDLHADFMWHLFPGPEGSILIHSVPYTITGNTKKYDRLNALGIAPVSNGCVRVSPEDAAWLKEWDPVGVSIKITRWSAGIRPADFR